jgi:2-polyprenyl-3-methyl-5-hydroxy-6-metoxy-1,4-benzoquinol methylase
MINLEKIAQEYHLASQSDMFIENICQEYELTWVKKLIPQGSKVLELGFGDGITFRSLAHYCDLSVVEGSQLIVKRAQEVAGELNVNTKIYQNFFETFVSEEKFDFVFASHVLEHVLDPKQILEKMSEWLKPNGKGIIIVPNSESIHRRLAVLMGLQPKLDTLSPRDNLVGHLRVFNLSELESLLISSGWQILEKRGFFFKPLSNSQMEGFDPSLIQSLCDISSQLPPEQCANLAVVVSKKQNKTDD